VYTSPDRAANLDAQANFGLVEEAVEMENKSVRGVTILGIFLLLCSVPALFAAIIGGISGSQAKTPPQILLDIIMRILFISSPAVFIITGMGLLKLKNWARLIVICLSPALSFIAVGISGIFLDAIMPPNIVSKAIILGTIIMSVGLIYYLTRSAVKEQFKQR
jgi:hypothetical protein